MIGLTATGLKALTGFGKVVPISCLVRNELNGERGMSEVVYTENEDGSQGVPYMPRVFPVGTWAVKKANQEFNKPSLGPWFFATDAHQLVDEWEIAKQDDGTWLYVKPTGRQVMDWGYGIHCSYKIENGVQVDEKYSDGCLHIVDGQAAFGVSGADEAMSKEAALDWIVNQVNNFYAAGGFQGEALQLQVVAT